MVDQEIRVLGDENIIANPKNSQKQYPLTFKAVSNVIVYGRKKDNLNFTVPIPEGVNFNFNLDRTSIIFSDNFNLEEYSYIMVKNPFEEIQDFFYVSSLEELDPTGKEFNEFNDEVVKWLRRLVNIISNRCMIFETTLFKDLNNFPNIKSGQTFIRTDDGWTGITIRDINSELDIIFNKYVEEVNKKIQEHQVQMNELLEQWKEDIQKYTENVKQYEIVRIVTQSGHGFVFEPVMYSISQRKFVKAVFPHGADGVAIRVDDNNFRLVWAGRVEIPSTAKDTQQRDFILGEYYFLGEGSNGGIQREKPDTYYQHLFQVMYSDELQQNIADVLLSVPINQKGKRWDVGEAKTTVNDIEELKMYDFPVGKVIEVLGYYKAGDGADHKRIISSTDDGSGVQLSNNLWANIVHNGEVNVEWFGIKYNKNGDSIDESLILDNYYILDKFSKYKNATTYVIGRFGKTISTLGSCQFIKENINIKIDSDIKTTYGYQEHFDKDPNIQSRGHWLAVFGGWLDESNFVMKPTNMIRIGGMGSIETIYSDKNTAKHNNNAIGMCRGNNVIVEDIRILGSDHNGIVFDSDTYFLKIQNVQISNCYNMAMKLKQTKHWVPQPDGLTQDKIGGIFLENCEIIPPADRYTEPLIRVEANNLSVKNCYFDCRKNTQKQVLCFWLTTKNCTFENCVFANINNVIRPYEADKCDNFYVVGCNFKDCNYITLFEHKNALKNYVVRNNRIEGHMYSPYGITASADPQNFNFEFSFNDCSKLTNAFNFGNANFYERNSGNIIFENNFYQNELNYSSNSKSIPITPNSQSKDFGLEEFKKYKFLILYFLKGNTIDFIQIPILFFFSSSYPLKLHLNQECDINITEIENNKTINITTTNSDYKITMISLIG